MEGVADEHRCPWREEAEALRPRVAELEVKLATVLVAMEALERRMLGPKSEKIPPPENKSGARVMKRTSRSGGWAALRRRERGQLRDQLRR